MKIQVAACNDIYALYRALYAGIKDNVSIDQASLETQLRQSLDVIAQARGQVVNDTESVRDGQSKTSGEGGS